MNIDVEEKMSQADFEATNFVKSHVQVAICALKQVMSKRHQLVGYSGVSGKNLHALMLVAEDSLAVLLKDCEILLEKNR